MLAGGRIAVQISLKCKNWWARERQRQRQRQQKRRQPTQLVSSEVKWESGRLTEIEREREGERGGFVAAAESPQVKLMLGWFWFWSHWSEHLINFACWPRSALLGALIKTPFTKFYQHLSRWQVRCSLICIAEGEDVQLAACCKQWKWIIINNQQLVPWAVSSLISACHGYFAQLGCLKGKRME